eukprot:gene6508-13142_t
MAQLQFVSSANYIPREQSASFTDIVIISDEKSSFESIALGSTLSVLLGICTSEDLEIMKCTVRNMSTKSDSTSEAQFSTFSDTSRTFLRRIVLALLPNQFSRHNCPSRSHHVSKIVKGAANGRNMIVLLMPTVSDYVFAQACAVSRSFPLYSNKSNQKIRNPMIDIVIHFPSEYTENLLEDIRNVSQNIRLCQELVDSPPNELHSDEYIHRVLQIKEDLNCSVHVIRGEQCRDQGLGGIWGVGKASEHLPALVILSHYPTGTNENTPSICLVGKGIVYDTGGLSIKSGTGMCGMKRDMAGSAAVLGAFTAISRTNASKDTPVHALLCIAENSVGPFATRPDDIHTLYSGKTVEINNTDAEGRLVLSDGCAYASKHLSPKYIIDIATLTGSQSVATGRRHAAIYCSDEELERQAVAVGKFTGDVTFPIIYCPEIFRGEFASQVADMKNSASDRTNALSSCAGQFIGNHIEEFLSDSVGGKWLHIDMAGPGHIGERATGYGVALLFGLVSEISFSADVVVGKES